MAKEYLAAIDNIDYEKTQKFIVPNQENITKMENIKNWSDKMTSIKNSQGQFTVVIEFEMEMKDGK